MKAMKKGLVLGIVAIAVAGLTGLASAGLPCAAYSTATLSAVQIKVCSTTDVIWDGPGAAGYLKIDVTVHDCLDNPVDTCSVRLDMTADFTPDPSLTGVGGILCGTGTMTAVTNANGAASFTITGGGAGALALNYTITAECAIPEVELASVSDTVCVKSTDFNGNGGTNFFDTFKYLPQLSSGTGYTGDLAGCSSANGVNFFDTFVYLPALSGAYACPSGGVTLSNVGTPSCSGPLLP